MVKPVRVAVEQGTAKTFVWALDWPGWCRGRRHEEQALEALIEYHARYAKVVELAGLKAPAAPSEFEVVERQDGDGSTDFGVPGMQSPADFEKVTPAVAKKQAALLRASWAYLDQVAGGSPEELRKGPRGGGRDRTKMLDHVVAAESSYGRSIGVKVKVGEYDDRAGVTELRDALVEVLGATSDGGPVHKKWTSRYATRRIIWHVLDHAWEMEDRADG